MDGRGLAITGALLWSLSAPPCAYGRPIVQAPGPPPVASCADVGRIDALLADSAERFNSRDAERGLALLREAHDLSAAPGCDARRAESLRRLAFADAYNHRFAEAATKLAESAATFERLGLSVRQADALLELGTALLNDGRHQIAVAPLQRARALAQAAANRRLELQTVVALAYAMEDGPAKEVLRTEGLALARAAPDGRLTECDILHEWGDSLFNADRYSDAFAMLSDALRCFEGTTARSKTGRAYVSLGRVYRAHGRLDAALEQYARAVALQDGAVDRLAAVQSLNAIGVTLGFMGRYGEGLERLQEALGIARRIGSERTVNFLLANIATFHLDQGRYAEGATALEEALATPGINFEVLRLAELTRAYVGLNQPERALEAGERALAAAVSDSEQITALTMRANAFIAAKRFEEASADLSRALAAVETIRANTIADDYFKRGFGQRYQGLFSSSIALLSEQGRTREAIETAERARARAFLDLLARSQAASNEPAYGASPATFPEIVEAAGRLQSTVVAYWVGQEQTFVWVIGADGRLASARIPVTANALAAMIQDATGAGFSAQAQIAAIMLGRGASARHWRTLYRVLLEPVQRHLPQGRNARLTIVPHGPLFGVPFAALRDSSGRYLIESFEVHYVPAIAVLRRAQSPTDRAAAALLVGDPGPEAARDRALPLPPLPWADREVSAIARMLPSGATLLRGRDATEANVRRHVDGRRLLHFATHGIVQNEEHLSSFLALRPSSGQGADSGAADGRLTANETYNLRLNADLIVLSGCRTAMGPIMGDGVIGFTRAFLSAGANSVLATMWDVADQTSFEAMRGFYSAWVAGAGKSQALRRAQLTLLRSLRAGKIQVKGVPLPESPRLWAGYVLVGQP